ncbi:MAG: hypothetical protein M3N22_11060 [Acidobacteriota bacterium]|nr:hypothetical protein [Acidobacteriota bacterium]
MSRNFRQSLFILTFTIVVFFVCAPRQTVADDVTSSMLIGNGRVDIVVETNDLKMPAGDIEHWVRIAAESVAAYYGRFPVPHLSLRISLFKGKGVKHGMTFGRHGGLITIHLGSESTPAELAADWMLTHEMIHLAFPSVPEQHHWIEEGIATYVEPIARIRGGHLTAEQMWMDLLRDLPKGLPQAGDRGLDNTHTWGRTYWGGALFCFLADIEMRRQTNNAKGLQDALRGILNAGGDINKDWPLLDALKAGDRAAGVSVLEPLYEKMKDQAVQVDLDSLWKDLGVQSDGTTVRFDNTAKLAAIRRGITSPGEARDPSATKPFAVFAGRTAMRR